MKRKVLTVILVLVVAVTAITVLGQGKKAEKAKDPVCGIMVDKDPSLSYNYKGEAFYFCSKADMEKFRKEPEFYLKKK